MQEKIKEKQLKILYSHLPVSILTAYLSLSFITYILWGNVDLDYYLIWFICFNFITMYRLSTLVLYKKLGINNLTLKLWDRLNLIGTFFTGSIWGMLTLFHSVNWPSEVSVCLWVALLALMAGASASFSIKIKYFAVYCVPILLFSVYTQFISGNYYLICIYLFFVMLLSMTSINFYNAQNSVIAHEVDLKESNLQLQSLASEDALTKLPNRRAYDNYFNSEWARNARHKRNLSLMMIDIDHFKNYNDNYGHGEGDKCLQDVARIIEQSLHRSSDMAARYGGEEFVIILPETPRTGAVAIADRLHEILRNKAIAHEFSNVSKLLTVSIGIAELIPRSGQDSKILQLLADKELYKAKANGRNCTSYNQEDS